MCSGFGEGHSAENVEKAMFSIEKHELEARGAALDATSTPFHQALQRPPLNLSSSRSLGWPQRLAQTYIMELRELVRLNSVAAQLLSSTAAHRRSAKGRKGRWSHISER